MNRASITVLIAAALLAGAFAGAAAATERPRTPDDEPRLEPLPVEVALAARSLGQFNRPSISQDGKLAAYTVCDSRRIAPETDLKYKKFSRTGASFAGLGCDVWVADTESGEAKNLTGEQGSNWSPTWSPDGSALVFYSDGSGRAALWIWERRSEKSRRVSEWVVRPNGLDSPRWTPDGRRIVVRVLPEGTTVEEAADLEEAPSAATRLAAASGATVTIFESPAAVSSSASTALPVGAWSTAGERGDLAVIEAGSGKSRRILTGEKPMGFWLSPDGSRLAFTNVRGFASGHTQTILYDLAVVPLAGGPVHEVAASIAQTAGLGVSWSPDGNRLAYMTGDGECYVVSAAGGAPRKAAQFTHPRFRDDEFTVPLWDAKGESLFFLAEDALWRVRVRDGAAVPFSKIDGQELKEVVAPASTPNPGLGRVLLVTTIPGTKNEGLYEVTLTTGAIRKLWEGAKSLSRDPSCRIAAAGGVVLLGLQDASSDEDWWVLRGADVLPRRLTRVNPVFEDYVMGRSRLIDWLSADGSKLQGALLLPAGHEEGKRYPLVVFVYGGGRLSRAVHTFGMRGGWGPDDNFQLLATRGYAVLLPDAPSDFKDQMHDLPKTVLPGINRVIDLGIADPERIGIMGHSNGGYSTLALITQTARFKAAIMRAGYGNFVSIYGELGRDGSHYGLGVAETAFDMGTPWDSRSRYLENSPVLYLDRVETPLLIVHGSVDPFVAPFLAEEVFVGLRRLGKKVTYARYEGESHWLQSYANQVDYCNRMIEWFDGHLKAPPPEESPDKEKK